MLHALNHSIPERVIHLAPTRQEGVIGELAAPRRELRGYRSAGTQRKWVYVPYDRLHDQVGPLKELAPRLLARD